MVLGEQLYQEGFLLCIEASVGLASTGWLMLNFGLVYMLYVKSYHRD